MYEFLSLRQLRNHENIPDGYRLIVQLKPNSTDRPIPVESNTFRTSVLIPSKGMATSELATFSPADNSQSRSHIVAVATSGALLVPRPH